MADITERIVIPEVPRVLDGQELYVYIPKAAIFDLNIEKGTGDVLVQTIDTDHSFKVMTDGRAKVRSAPIESNDVVRKSELDTKLDKGLIPSQYLPSYVDDVVEYDSKSAFPATGEEGKIYVDKSTNLTYRWSGSTYIQVGGGDLNLENGTGTGSLVQKTVSSSGTPYANEANGSGSVALGKDVKSNGNTTFVIGQKNKATGLSSFTSGYSNINRGDHNITGGENNTNNDGWNLVVGKNNSVDSGRFGIISGLDNVYNGPANNENSSVSMLGKNLYVQGENQPTNGALLIGQYNKVQNNSGRLFIVGNGTSNDDRKNAFEVLDSGKIRDGKGVIDVHNLTDGEGTGSLVQKRLKSDGITWTTAKAYQGASTALGGNTQAGRTEEEFNAYFWDSVNNVALNGGKGKDSQGNILDSNGLTYAKSYSYALAEGESTKALGRSSHAEGNATQSIGNHSHAEGLMTKAEGYVSHAEGNTTSAIGAYSHAEGSYNIAEGENSHSEGANATASGHNSHAEGEYTKAQGKASHSEGHDTQAIGECAHSEGLSTKAEGYAAHTEGAYTEAYYTGSHAEGDHTKTYAPYQHVGGTYNHYNINALYQVGNGTSDNDRKNAFEVLKDGRAKVQSAPIDDDDVVRKIELDKSYELIEEITLTEDTNTINRTDYNFKELYIRVDVPQYTDTHNVLFVINDGGAINCRDVINKSFNAISAIYASIKGNLLFLGYTQNTNSESNALEYKQGVPYVNVSKINKLTLSQDAGNVIPAGTVIQIYGR